MNVLVDGEIVLFGTVGEGLFMDGFTALDVVEALAEIGRGKDVTVRLNSGGGIAWEGAAIFNALNAHRGSVTVYVESIAASAASLIAMAGNEIVMRPGSMMMIHDPAAITMGNSADHSKTIEALEALAVSMADIYAERSGKTPEETRADMKAETWMTASEAKAKGYADRVDRSKAKAKEPTAFDYRLYRHAPERMTALAKSRDWTISADNEAEETAVTQSQKEQTMADKEADGAAKILAEQEAATKIATEAKAKADAEAAKTETPEQITARVTADVQKRTADIVAVCTMQGKADRASAFIAEGKSLSDVVAVLQKEKAEKGDEISARNNGVPAVAKEITSAWDKAVEKVNARIK
jgi:ATP-dependent Clp protease protease subunit